MSTKMRIINLYINHDMATGASMLRTVLIIHAMKETSIVIRNGFKSKPTANTSKFI